MPWWQWLADVAGVLLLLVLLWGIALVVRRRTTFMRGVAKAPLASMGRRQERRTHRQTRTM